MTDRYEAICAASPDALLLVDSDGVITYANDRVTDLFGYEPEAVVGESVELLVPPDVRERHVEFRDQFLEDPLTRPMGADLELSGWHKDGHAVPVDVSLSPLEAEGDGTVMAAVRDVREQRGLRQRYRSILEAVPDAVVVAEAATGEIVEANEQVGQLFGYEPAELIGLNQTDLHPPSERDAYRALFERHRAPDERIVSELPDGSDTYIVTKDGSRVPVEINARVFELGDTQLIVGAFRDISDRRAYEQQLAALNEIARDLFRVADREALATTVAEATADLLERPRVVVRLIDDGGNLQPLGVTDAARAAMGERPAYSVYDGSPVSAAFTSGQPRAVSDFATVDDAFDRGETRSGLYVPIGEHGVISVVSPTTDAFDRTALELTSILAATADAALDRLADAAELRRQNERLEEFIGVVAHDLRNPLTIAQGRLEFALAEFESGDLETVDRALERMDELIENTLTLAREGKTIDAVSPIEMAPLAERCWAMVDTGSATLSVDEALRLRADPDRLRQVLENLFRNAAEHGGPDVTVSIGRLGEDGFYVEDDGPGIPEDERSAVFEAGHTSTSGGTGFGLAIVRRIATAHGWTVAITDGSDGGTRFEFTDVDVLAEGATEPGTGFID